jgi:hypothetical protein
MVVDVVGLAGVTIGAAAVLLAAYSVYNQRKSQGQLNQVQKHTERLQEQMDRKDNLRNLAEGLQRLISTLDKARSGIVHPRTSEDTNLEFRDLGRDILAFQHGTGENPTLKLTKLETGGEDSIEINNVDQALDIAKRTNHSILLHLKLTGANHGNLNLSQSYLIWDAITYINISYDVLDWLDANQKEVLNEFDNEILDRVERTIDTIFKGIIQNAIERKSGQQFNPDDYSEPAELAEDVFHYFLYYDGIEEDVESLSNKIDELQALRLRIMQTSYS